MAASLDSLHLHVARVHDLISDTVEHAWRNALPRQRSEIMLSRTPPKPSPCASTAASARRARSSKSSAGSSPSSSHGSPADRLAEAIRLQADAVAALHAPDPLLAARAAAAAAADVRPQGAWETVRVLVSRLDADASHVHLDTVWAELDPLRRAPAAAPRRRPAPARGGGRAAPRRVHAAA